LVQHVCAVIRFTGPVHGTWMFTFERWIKIAKKVLHSGHSAAEGIMKNIMLHRWSLMTRYKTKEQLDNLLAPPLDHQPVDDTPDFTRSFSLVGKAEPKVFEYSENPKRVNTFRLIYLWLLHNDPLFKAINAVYKSVVPKSYYTGGKESIDVWLRSRHWDEANHLRMVQNAAKGVGVNINTVDELANILRGPQYYKSYKRCRLNGSEFCSTAWEVRDRGTRSTTRRVIKYRLKDNSKREFDFGFGYAMIEGIYEFRSHSLLESSKVYQLLRIHNFSRKMVTPTRYETHPSQLTRVARASKSNNVHYHSAVIPINDVSAFNVALWPDGDTANYFIVHVHVDPDTIPGRVAPVEENDANNQPNDDMEEEFDELDEEHARRR
jgi:hypothetical protein